MGKTKAFHKRKVSISRRSKGSKKRDSIVAIMRDDVGITQFVPSQKLTDVKLIGAAIMECLIDNDPAGIIEVIETYLEALNKSKFLKSAGVPRSTAYQLFKRKNPTIQTLAKIVHAAHQAAAH